MIPDHEPAGLAGLALGLLGQLLPPDPSDARPEFRLLIQARHKLDPHSPLDSLAAHAREEDWRLLGLQGELGLSSGELLAVVLAAAVETDPLVGQAVAALQAPLAGSRSTLGLLARLPGCGLARLAGGAAVTVGLLELLDPDRPLVERGLRLACRLRDWLPVQVLELAPGERRRTAALPGYDGPRLALTGPDGQLDAGELALLELDLPLPPRDERLTLWRRVLGASAPDSLADPLLGPARIAAVGRRAVLGAELDGVAWDPERVRAAALAEARGGLEALALPLPEAVPDAALEEWYNGHSDTSLRTKLDDHLSGDDLSFALGLLSGSAKTRAETRLAIARDSTNWLGPNRAAREAVLRSFSPEEWALLDPAVVAKTRRVLQGDLRGESLTISEAYLDDDPARALGARLKEHLDKARRKGDEAIRQAMGEIDGLIQQEFQFVHPDLRQRIQAQLDKLPPEAAAEHLAHIKALAAGLDAPGLRRLMEQAAADPDPAGELLRARLEALGGTNLLDKLKKYEDKDPAATAQARRTLARLLQDGGSEALAVIDLVKSLGRAQDAVGRLAEAHQVLAMGLPHAQQAELLAVVAKPRDKRRVEHKYTVSDALNRLGRLLPEHPSGELATAVVNVLRRVEKSEMEGLLTTLEQLHGVATRLTRKAAVWDDLFAALVGVMDTQRYYNEFMKEAAPLLKMLSKPSADPAQAQRVADVLDYIRQAQGDHNELAQVAADLRAAGKALEGASDPARRFAEQHQSLTGDAKRLAGGDAWAARLGEEAGRWSDLAKTHPDFAKLLDAALPGAGEGLKALLAGQPRQWFEHLATLKGATTHQQQLALLKGLLAGAGSLGSEGQFKKLFRAIREATVDADLAGRKLNASDAEQTVARLRDQIKDRKQRDRALLKNHLDALAEQDQRYRRMIELAEELNALGIKGGLGAELGASAREIGAWKARRTEVLGEIALTDHMLRLNNGAWELALNFAKGTGFDQVWLRREHGQVVEYLIGEAKGPGAQLGATDSKGPQMLRRWVEETVEDMWDRRLPLGDELLQAIADGKPPLRGLIVQATGQGAKLLDFKYSGGYRFAEHDRFIDELIRRYLAAEKKRTPEPLDHPDLIDEDPL